MFSTCLTNIYRYRPGENHKRQRGLTGIRRRLSVYQAVEDAGKMEGKRLGDAIYGSECWNMIQNLDGGVETPDISEVLVSFTTILTKKKIQLMHACVQLFFLHLLHSSDM